MRATPAPPIPGGLAPAPSLLHPRPLAALLLAAALGACAAGTPPDGDPSPADRAERVGNAIVIRSASFEGNPNLLQVLTTRVSSMEVSRRGPCPDLVFRGRSSLQGSSSARVYVNGQPAVNTCVLEMVSTWDVERVEVYPSGIVRRPGYPVSGTGSILVFTKRGDYAAVPASN
jgi:hypothetical protein